MRKFVLTGVVLSTGLSLGLTTVASAAGFRAENRVMVQPASGGGISVAKGGGFGARGMWCAAADYARDVIGASGTARLYVVEPRGSVKAPVVFDLDPRGTNPTPVFTTGNSLRQPGANLSVDHAQSFCADAKLINTGN